jgi:hypothetical protein
MGRQPSSNKKVPTGSDSKIVNEPRPEDLAPTLTETNETITYDTSQPVFMVSKKRAGKINIPLYEEVPQVQGYFKNLEHPGQPITIPHRAWKGPIRYFTLVENKLISIPVTLCDLLNNKTCYIEKKWVTSDGRNINRPIMSAGGNFVNPDISKEVNKRIQRFQFQVNHNVSWKPRIVDEQPRQAVNG